MDMRPSPVSRGLVRCLPAGCLMVLVAFASVGAAQDRGELTIEGTHITRLVLCHSSDNHIEKWSNLEGSIRLPVGTYSVQQLELRGGCNWQGSGLAKIEVGKDKPAVLKAGGPLRQTIDVTRQGRTLVLNYRLLGIGGEQYTSPKQPDKRATFTVYRGDKAIATGAFEYG